MTPKDFTAGQTVYVTVRRQQHEDLEAYVVSKIGRQWVTIKRAGGYSEDRFDPTTMRVDHNIGHGRIVHLSREAYEAEVARRDAWRKFHVSVRQMNHAPAHLTTEDIEKLSALLSEDPA